MSATFSEAGFSLIEILVSIGIFTVIIAASITGVRALSSALDTSINTASDEQFVSSLDAQLRHDAVSSLGIRTIAADAPSEDSVGSRATNATPVPNRIAGFSGVTPSPDPLATMGPQPIENGIEFAVTDAAHRWHHWSYRLQNGLQLTQDGVTQVLDTKVSAFTAEFIPANRLAEVEEAGDAFKNLPAPTTHTYNLDGQQITNGVVRVKITRGKANRTILLATRITPSGFGIEAGPQWRPIVWRQGVISKFWFGSDSHYNVNGVVQYSTDNWKHAKTWCSHTLASNDDVSSDNTDIKWVSKDKSFIRQPDQIFKWCQKDTGNQEISETPPPVSNYCPFFSSFHCIATGRK